MLIENDKLLVFLLFKGGLDFRRRRGRHKKPNGLRRAERRGGEQIAPFLNKLACDCYENFLVWALLGYSSIVLQRVAVTLKSSDGFLSCAVHRHTTNTVQHRRQQQFSKAQPGTDDKLLRSKNFVKGYRRTGVCVCVNASMCAPMKCAFQCVSKA